MKSMHAATQYAGRMAERWSARLSKLFDHTFDDRQNIVLHAGPPHSYQTNVSGGVPGGGVGGT